MQNVVEIAQRVEALMERTDSADMSELLHKALHLTEVVVAAQEEEGLEIWIVDTTKPCSYELQKQLTFLVETT